mmetsp:Transcript_67952/g.214928  ORF Transcript_67952/g.214928 Transcript_67952/m.214928 type:complete len:332 (-) Transcript_67952:625-1620(-)
MSDPAATAALSASRFGRADVAAVDYPGATAAEPEGAAPGHAAQAHPAPARRVLLFRVQREVAVCGAVTHLDLPERFKEVVVGHPEGAVVFVLGPEPHPRHRVLLPLLGAVRPRPLPLELPPGVAQLHQARVVLDSNLHGPQDRVGVPGHQALRVLLLAHPGVEAGGDEGLGLKVALDEHPHLVVGVLPRARLALDRPLVVHVGYVVHDREVPKVALLVAQEPEGVITGHRPPRPLGVAAVQLGVASAELGEGLLEDDGPELIAVGLHVDGAEPPRRIFLAGDPVVDGNDYELPRLAIPQPDRILAPGVVFRGEKARPDALGMLRGRCKGGH